MNKKSDNLEALRTTAEAELAHSPKPKPAGELLHELQLQQTELEMQNEELRRAQLALEESRDRYVELYEFAPVGYITLTRDGMISEINLTGAKLLDVERKKLLRRRFDSFVVPDQQNHWNRLFAGMLQSSEATSCELTLKTGAGERIYANLNCKRHENDGEPPVVRITLSNITERRLAEEDVIKERIKLNTLFDSIPDAIFVTDMDGHFLQANHSACERLGFSLEELLQMGPADIDAPEYAAKVPERIKALQERGELVFESAHVRKDGAVIPIEISNRLVDYGGKSAIIGVVRDITKRKQTEESLLASEKKFSLIFDKSTFAIALSRLPNGEFIDVNEAWMQLFGYAKEEVIGKTSLELGMNIDFALRASLMAELQQQGLVRNVETTCMTRNGEARTLLVNVDMIDMGGQKYALTTLKDITGRKAYEQQLRELTAHLQTVREEEKASIAREIHDDLGGTLTALKMEAYWLAEELSASKVTEPLLKHVGLISQLTDNAVNVTRRVITGLRPTILDDLGLLAALEWQAGQFHMNTGIACRVNSIGDKAKLDKPCSIALFRIFQESLTNVARHSGATRVEVEFHSSDEGVMLSVSDDGRGLPDGHTISPTSFGVRGMCERVEQLGGKIKFDSPPGGGFNVTVTLPPPAETTKESKA